MKIDKTQKQQLMIGGGAVTVVSVAWVYFRLSERKKLASRLQESSSLIKAKEWAAANQPVAPSDAWLLDPGGIDMKAAEVVPIMGTASADSAYLKVLAGLPKNAVSIADSILVQDIAEVVPGGQYLLDLWKGDSTGDAYGWDAFFDSLD